MRGGYGDDLAFIHDAGFSGFARSAAPGLLGLMKRAGVAGGRVVDLGCGSGIWAAALCRGGYEVLGIDLSPAMIRLARRNAPEARYRVGSLLTTPIPPCDAVTSLGECFNYLFDRRNDRRGLMRLFGRVHAALRPGGLFIFDVAEPGRAAGRQDRPTVAMTGDFCLFARSTEDPARRLLTRRITTFRKVADRYRREEEVHHLRLLEGKALLPMLRRTGFRARLVRGYGGFRFPPSYAGLVARKP